MNFYKRNYIEGLFLSSAVEGSPDATMLKLYEAVCMLRKEYRFNGYIHLKGIPGADESLIYKCGCLADRMSFNIELPSEKSLKLLAPQKSKKAIITPMKMLTEEKITARSLKTKGFLPAGQTTQMIVGASGESDGHILRLTKSLYNKFLLKRVYYSSYIPLNKGVSLLPSTPAGLLREHRLYQADWLLRFYGFDAEELLDEDEDFDLQFDPKCYWAMKNMQYFPIEVNTAPPEWLLRVPGIGIKSAHKIISTRRYGKITFESLAKMRVVMKRAKYFITCGGKFIGVENPLLIRKNLILDDVNFEQMSMFSGMEVQSSVLTGEL